ncbi:hypothetical protein DCCM_3960 [Desulfocucumis palustris]|uniref:Uncharacterized protein n=1 Tax=Desulfocucumis palustris TaxID=1898651 RepID=A0A2L2XFA4_9FIRM|nr:hypothetical protein DCCM_3960 [Desulfocucumis palustris]
MCITPERQTFALCIHKKGSFRILHYLPKNRSNRDNIVKRGVDRFK